MPRLMSVSLTEQAVINRTKTVTRRNGWKFLKPGDRLTLCRKVMGRHKGEPLARLAEVEVVRVNREPLGAISPADVAREGLAPMTPPEFVEFFCTTHRGVRPDSEITRIEWRYLDSPTPYTRPPVRLYVSPAPLPQPGPENRLERNTAAVSGQGGDQ